MSPRNPSQSQPGARIVTVGSGTVENVLRPRDNKIALGRKHTADFSVLYGGSGLNYSMRLLSAGYAALPILAIGKDEHGLKIQSALLAEIEKGKGLGLSRRFIGEVGHPPFFDNDIQTANTIILVHGAQRTIFTQAFQYGRNFIDHVRRRVVDAYDTLGGYPDAVMIGHIHSDISDGKAPPGESTKFIIETFKEKSILFANFGNTQIALGLDYWKPYLPQIDLFQLNLEEAKRFFSDKKENATLVDVVDTIRSLEMTAVITLDKFGAIGIHRHRKDSIVLAWPLIGGEDIVDSTGAGDAFGAGLVSSVCNGKGLDYASFHNAIEVARAWSALACQTLGGCSDCPDRATIEQYKKQIADGKNRPIEIKDQNYATEIMSLIDIAFSG